MRPTLALLLLATAVAHAQVPRAQLVSVGVVAGVPLTTAPEYAGLAKDVGRWTVGVTARVHLVAGLAVEVDALMRSYSYQRHATAVPQDAYQQDVKAWDFPMLLRYGARSRRVSPFIAAGYALTHESFDTSTLPGHLTASRTGSGPVLGVGVEWRHKRLALAPELRCMRLIHTGPADSTSTVVTALLAVTF